MAFRKDLKFGDQGVDYFISLSPKKLEKTDGFAGDILLKASGSILELKTDRRAASETNNIFVEQYSHHLKKTVGGPWQAQKHGCKYYAYLFEKCKSLYIYKVSDLIKYITENKKELRHHQVNRTYSNASGFIISIDNLKHLELKLKDIIRSK